jgi:hypothetical protein
MLEFPTDFNTKKGLLEFVERCIKEGYNPKSFSDFLQLFLGGERIGIVEVFENEIWIIFNGTIGGVIFADCLKLYRKVG